MPPIQSAASVNSHNVQPLSRIALGVEASSPLPPADASQIETAIEAIFEIAMRIFGKVEGMVARIGNLQTEATTFTCAGSNSPIWECLVSKAEWSPRDGAGLVEFDSKLWLVGGYLGSKGLTNEVWNSDDGIRWRLMPTPPWTPRHLCGLIVHDKTIFLVGGDQLDDVWSTHNGIDWTLVNSKTPFKSRYGLGVISYGNWIYVMGGQSWSKPRSRLSLRGGWNPILTREAIGFNDVWRSIDGDQWEKITDAAPWAKRALFGNPVVHNDRIFLIGGGLKAVFKRRFRNFEYSETVQEFTDVWSTTDGFTWRSEPAFPGPARTHFSVVASGPEIFVFDGSIGTQANVSNNCFRFRNNEWSQLPNGPWTPRHASSVACFRGQIVFAGGLLENDVWALRSDSSDIILPRDAPLFDS